MQHRIPSRHKDKTDMRKKTVIVILALTIPVFVILNLIMGSVSIPVMDVIKILCGNADGDNAEVWSNIIMRTRLPQSVTAMACGAGLSTAGLLMQTVFRNPLAGPSVLGISSAASLGVAFVVLFSGIIGASLAQGLFGNVALTLAAVIGALVVMGVMLYLSNQIKSNATLLIVGVMIGYIASAIVGVLKYFSSEEDIHTYVIWGLGSFSRVTGGQVYLFSAIVAVVLPFTLLLSKMLNILQLGDIYAASLGLNIKRARTFIIAAAGILTAVVTAYCGPIMFLGLAVPHICRGLLNTSDHRALLPATIFCGASLALLCNLIARLPGFDGALPINSVTALIGAPIVLQILLRKGKKN